MRPISYVWQIQFTNFSSCNCSSYIFWENCLFNLSVQQNDFWMSIFLDNFGKLISLFQSFIHPAAITYCLIKLKFSFRSTICVRASQSEMSWLYTGANEWNAKGKVKFEVQILNACWLLSLDFFCDLFIMDEHM